jgi:hypothetical protein
VCKKKLDRGDPSPGITAARAARLEALDFVCETQDAAWEAKLARLAAYKKTHGDCNVPQGWAEDPPLSRWVSDHRMGKKKLDRGDPSPGITAARAARLVALDFVWDTLDVAWEAQLARLAAYKKTHGDCNVPQGWAEDPRLGRWVSDQRRARRSWTAATPARGSRRRGRGGWRR